VFNLRRMMILSNPSLTASPNPSKTRPSIVPGPHSVLVLSFVRESELIVDILTSSGSSRTPATLVCVDMVVVVVG
jgi:hypothetical protein